MKYTSQNTQMTLDLFRSSLEGLDKTNRWVMLGDNLPWGALEKLYNSRLNNKTKGAGNIAARKVIGAMIIKHKLCLSDEETVQIIRENPYMQYMCGFTELTDKPIFDPSLFVTIRTPHLHRAGQAQEEGRQPRQRDHFHVAHILTERFEGTVGHVRRGQPLQGLAQAT